MRKCQCRYCRQIALDITQEIDLVFDYEKKEIRAEYNFSGEVLETLRMWYCPVCGRDLKAEQLSLFK